LAGVTWRKHQLTIGDDRNRVIRSNAMPIMRIDDAGSPSPATHITW